MIKKAFRIVLILLVIVIAAAVAIPYFFKDEIIAAVKEDINKNFNAKVEFGDVNLSLFRDFPNFSFNLKDLSITGMDEFEGYTLVKADDIDLSLDLASVISSEAPIEINSVQLTKPVINIKVLRNGKANYDIVKPSDAPVETEPVEPLHFTVQLSKYSIEDGELIYDDRATGTYLELIDLDHSGNGAFTQDIFDLSTTTQVKSITAQSGGVAYLRKAKSDIDLVLNIDMPNSKYTIADNRIQLNALTLNTEGFIQLVEEKVNLDIKYDAPKNNFKNFLSMIPSAYTADFADVEANGNLQFNGFVRGNYNMTTGALPAFKVNLKVDNADFKYPDLPIGISAINTNTSINSPSSDLDKMVIDVSNFSMKLGNNPFDASLKLWTVMSDPNIDSKINGTINLDELSKAFPMEGVKTLNGIITSNLTAKTSMSAIDQQDYENVDMAGDLQIENMDYEAEGMPRVLIKDMQMTFNPKNVTLSQFDANLGKSDIQARGTIDNIMAFFSPDKTMTGNLVARSQFFDTNEWMPEDSMEESSPTVAVNDSLSESYEVFDRFDFTLDGEVGKLLYDVYELKNTKLIGQVTPNQATIKEFKTQIGESDFQGRGTINNVFNYLYENETMSGDLNLISRYINLNEFMAEVPSDTPAAQTINENVVEELEPAVIPEKMRFDINADIGKILYTNIELKDIRGKMHIDDQVLSMEDCKAKTLGGSITMNGNYNTQNPEKPTFDMDYNIDRFGFQDAFEKLNTFAALAPIGKFIEGQFNTTLKINGALGKDMMPDLSTLSADGFLQTINGTLNGFKPIEKFADKINLNFLKSIDLKNTKNWFEVKNGMVSVQEFDLKAGGIDMKIGGAHGFNTDMTYNIKAKVPRKLLQKNNVGQAADKGLKFLQGQASKLGIDIAQSEFINVAAVISGSITDPKIKLNLLGADGEALSTESIVDEVKDAAVDKAASLVEEKTGIDIKKIDQEVADAKANLQAELDAELKSINDKLEQQITKNLTAAQKKTDKAKAEAIKLAEQGRKEGYKQADELIKKAGNNPFKKEAAKIAAKKLRQETDKKAEQLIQKAEDTAKNSMVQANKQADNLRETADQQSDKKRAEYQKKMEEKEAEIRGKYEKDGE